tara:strand:- start:13395 stop:14111 length:717 start_codon:yes stop_codon:yes gene_type:complete
MRTFKMNLLAAAALGLALAPGAATAQDEDMQADTNAQAETETAIVPDVQTNPYRMADGSWVSLSGTVTNATAHGFDLDYGAGIVPVEMDDYDAWPEAYLLADGQNVGVVGKIDDDLFELTSIEASTVYVAGLNTSFSASSADEESLGEIAFYHLPDLSNVVLEGKVKDVDVKKGEFSLVAGGSSYDVSIEDLGYNPLDEIGFQEIANGDRVRITGMLDKEAFTDDEIDATSIVTLNKG